VGAGHDHGHALAGAGQKHRGRLWAAVALLAGFLLVEAVVAILSGSLALLSDAGHMFTDVLGIGMALAAMTAAAKAAGGDQHTFGLYRLEVLAALANALLLTGVAVYVLIEAVSRLGTPHEVATGPMLIVAIGGLLVNLIAFALLRSGAKESINVRGAYLEVLGDLFSSVGVIIAALIIMATGWWYADPLVAVAVAVLIVPRTWKLGMAALRILVQAAPAHLDVTAVRSRLAEVPGVCDVHDLHVWTLTSGMDVASAHLRLEPAAEASMVLTTAREALHHDFHIDHATLQLEPQTPTPCGPSGW
jgi:cobalt-zinc-cadmium efflux system protein